mgnify:CR=1 FL=1
MARGLFGIMEPCHRLSLWMTNVISSGKQIGAKGTMQGRFDKLNGIGIVADVAMATSQLVQ